MFRRLVHFSRRLIDGVGQAFRDLGNIVLLPFRGGFRPIRAMRRLFSDIGSIFSQPLRSINSRNLKSTISRDSQSIIVGGQMVAQQTTATAAGVLKLIALSPVFLIRWLITAPPRFWFFLRTRSWLQLGIGTAVTVIGLTAVIWPIRTVRRERVRTAIRKEQDRQLEVHFVKGDIKGVKHNLEKMHEMIPDDEQVTARLKALESGESPPNDYKMAGLLMREHYGHVGRWPLAIREAEKYLAMNANDWEALLILADVAMHKGDRNTAIAKINQLPPPRDVPAWACTVADQLFRALGDNERRSLLLEYVARDYVPMIRSALLVQQDLGFQVQMVELYNIALEAVDIRSDLKSYWVPVQEVCHFIANAKDPKPIVLERLGTVQENQLAFYLQRLEALGLITTEEHKQFADEIENRLTIIWQRLRLAKPDSSMAILGLAMQEARAGNLPKATAIIDEGIELCGERPEFIEKKADLLRRYDPATCLAFVEKTLAKKELSLPICRVLAQAALASNRPDQALEAVKKAHAIHPDLPWVCMLEAQALLQAGRSDEAAGALHRILPYVGKDPTALAMYMQALVASGAASTAGQYLHELFEGDKTSAIVIYGADKLAQLGHQDISAKVLREVLGEHRTNTAALVLLSDCLRQLAENGRGPGWDRDLISEAISGYRIAKDRFPKNLQLINNIAWLELIALNQKESARETAKPMQDAKELPAPMLETVGAIHLAFGEYDSARVIFEKAIRARGERALNCAFLAHAYHGLGRTNDAMLYIRKAIAQPKSNPRESEIIEGIRRILDRSSG